MSVWIVTAHLNVLPWCSVWACLFWVPDHSLVACIMVFLEIDLTPLLLIWVTDYIIYCFTINTPVLTSAPIQNAINSWETLYYAAGQRKLYCWICSSFASALTSTNDDHVAPRRPTWLKPPCRLLRGPPLRGSGFMGVMLTQLAVNCNIKSKRESPPGLIRYLQSSLYTSESPHTSRAKPQNILLLM